MARGSVGLPSDRSRVPCVGVDDPTGVSDSVWARWSRGWTSEENRHGDLLNRYLYLTGRVDMRSIEVGAALECVWPAPL
jgi:hypothetical protein